MKAVMRAVALAALTVCLASLAPARAGSEGETTMRFDNAELRRSRPANYEPARAAAQGLGDGESFSEEWFALQAFYAQAVWRLLSDECEIMALDAQIGSAPLRFLPAIRPKNGYQAHWSFGAKYLFLRNNVHIERLDGEDVEALTALVAAGDAGSEAVRAFVMRTRREVLCVYPELENDAIEAEYERDGRLAPNDAIVLGLATRPEYDGRGRFRDVDHEKRKRDALTNMIEEAQLIMTERLGIEVRILQY